MMRCLIFDFLTIVPFFKDDPATYKGLMQQNIDFIDRQPIFDQPAIALEDGFRIGHIEINESAIFPAPKFLDQMQRNIEVGNRDQWLDLMFSQFFEDFLIKKQAFFVGLFVIAIWKNH